MSEKCEACGAVPCEELGGAIFHANGCEWFARYAESRLGLVPPKWNGYVAPIDAVAVAEPGREMSPDEARSVGELSDEEWDRLAGLVTRREGTRSDVQMLMSAARLHRTQHMRLRQESEALLAALRKSPLGLADPDVVHQAKRLSRLLRDGTAD